MLTAQKLENASQISLSEFAYNDKGKISDAWETVLDLSEAHIQYAYDNAGLLTQTAYPGGLQVSRTNTWDGRIDTLTRASGTAYKFAEYDYIGGRVAQRRYGPDAGTKMYYKPQYDNLGRMTRSYTYKAGNPNTTITDFVYSYVPQENNIDQMEFDHRTGSPYNEFTYDNLDRVTDVTYLSNSQDVEAFPMDDLGNRVGDVTQRDGVHTYTSASPNLTNRYTSIDSVSITHDAAGNLTLDKDGYHYVYDYENRVTRIYKLDGQTEIPVADYTYDALGRRVEVKSYFEGDEDLVKRYWYNDQWQVLSQEWTWPGYAPIYRNLVYGNYIDEALCFRWVVSGQPGQRNYFLHDHLYSPAAMISSSGSVVERYEYDVYGKRSVKTSGFQSRTYSLFGNDFGLTGREVDDLDFDEYDTLRLQHMHYRHRDYSPFMGRFVQHDLEGLISYKRPNPMYQYHIYHYPLMSVFQNNIFYEGIVFKYYKETNMNLYEYVRSSPLLIHDADGLAPNGCGPVGIGGDLVPDYPPGGADFSEACNDHDSCYEGNGPGGCNTNKKGCDDIFLTQLKEACKKADKSYLCEAEAYIYYIAVSTGGTPSFDNARDQNPNCDNDCPYSPQYPDRE